ncbi:hypothetical protein P3W24_09830 [Luteibacter sp. PPL201]|uniref:Uncharacterized protein n=1 Tax=Luteibacter sahnii TaxID=3021977 RepID=A0ABT6BB47_9GAMM|nr:hypothetical protein [Luteibacter sp. PPL193]MDY1547237.1 hypothetical protein [Luteibacter sp. PPL193]
MLAQYVYTAAEVPFRIVRHGHRWRALQGPHEIGRYDTPEDAVRGLRDVSLHWVPRRLSDWRFIPDAALAHLAPPTQAALARLAAAA